MYFYFITKNKRRNKQKKPECLLAPGAAWLRRGPALGRNQMLGARFRRSRSARAVAGEGRSHGRHRRAAAAARRPRRGAPGRPRRQPAVPQAQQDPGDAAGQ